MQISYDAYRVFYYVARHRSFTKAAQALYSNQPNVTRTIKHLEEALGCPLFLRTSRGVRLTPEGEELLAHIAPAMEQIQAGEDAILLHSRLHRGVIHIGASEIALHCILLPVLQIFRQEYTGIRLHILNSNTQQAVEVLRTGQVDFSLATDPLELPEHCGKTILTHFQEVAVCSAAYDSFGAEPVSLDQLAEQPLISLCKGSSSYQIYSAWFQDHGLAFSPDIEAATADQILPMVRSNLGIGFIQESTAREAAKGGRISVLNLLEKPPMRTICLLKREDQSLCMAAKKLEAMLLDYAGSLPPVL